MAGIKRAADGKTKSSVPTNKKQKTSVDKSKKSAPRKEARSPESDSIDDDVPVDDAEIEDGGSSDEEAGAQLSAGRPGLNSSARKEGGKHGDQANGDKKFKLATSSAEAHAAQRALAKERKAAKPNADLIARSKKLWEKLRRKSHVPLEERKELVSELYAIINGRVHDFVFKHDVVRVVQCALKYANKEQRLNITKELQADIRPLVESKYGKFMVAKIVVEGDQEIRNLVIPEFYGHVKRLINHPEAAWIVDDIYRQVANVEQRARMLREWYGQEFALDNKIKAEALKQGAANADLAQILHDSPEKRAPIMRHLHQMINSLIQKKMTGFTMLHDAMNQYMLNVAVGSEEHNEFLENLRSDLDDPSGGGDLLKNLAFTKSGSRIICRALALSSAKDRKLILRIYKDHIETMAYDANAYQVLLAALEVTDDTKMSAKAILSELLFENVKDDPERWQRLSALLVHLTARVPVLYFLAGDAKWLLPKDLPAVLTEVHDLRSSTSKKAPATRKAELLAYTATPLASLVANTAGDLITTTSGCQIIAEVILEALAQVDDALRASVIEAVAGTATGDPKSEGHIAQVAGAGRLFKSLCQGGKFNKASGTVIKPEKSLGFANVLYDSIKGHITDWATGPSSFVVVGLAETDDLDKDKKAALLKTLKKDKKALEAQKDNAGSRILLKKL